MITCPFHAGRFNANLDILICCPAGKLTVDLAHDIATCRECLVRAGLPQVNRFHDMRGITGVELSFLQVIGICKREACFRDEDTPIKACYLVSNPVVFGTLSMYASLIDQRGVEAHISYELNELADVLEVDATVLEAACEKVCSCNSPTNGHDK